MFCDTIKKGVFVMSSQIRLGSPMIRNEEHQRWNLLEATALPHLWLRVRSSGVGTVSLAKSQRLEWELPSSQPGDLQQQHCRKW